MGREEIFPGIERAGDGEHLIAFDGVFLRYFRHDQGDAFGQHGFAGSRRPQHEKDRPPWLYLLSVPSKFFLHSGIQPVVSENAGFKVSDR